MMHQDRERLCEALGETELERLMKQGAGFSLGEAITFAREMHDLTRDLPQLT